MKIFDYKSDEGENMKKSKYNFLLKVDENVAIYNSYSNSLALLDSDDIEMYEKIEERKELPKEFQELKDMNFVLDDDDDELSKIKYDLLSSRFNNSNLSLTIAPTLACNFNCSYCYEKNAENKKSMNESTENSIIEFISEQIERLNTLSISWYGGEPLLEFDSIKRLSDKIIKMCDEHNVMYTAFIVTNGYLLTREIVEQFNSLKINSIQVTLDGSKEWHDKKRILHNGNGTYDIILKNLKDNYEFLPGTHIRINLDSDNKNSYNQVIDDIKQFDKEDKMLIYVAPVENENDSYEDSHCIQKSEFFEKMLEFHESYGENTLLYQYPYKITNFCGADYLKSLVINSNGDLYKCWSDIGFIDRKIGNINDNSSGNTSMYYDYMLYDPTEDEECKKCKLLPICMGGCPYQRVVYKKKACNRFKENMDDFMKKIVKIRIEQVVGE